MPEKLPSSPLNICDKLDAKNKNVSIATQEMRHGDARKARVLVAVQIGIYYYSHTSARNMDVAVFKLMRPLFWTFARLLPASDFQRQKQLKFKGHV